MTVLPWRQNIFCLKKNENSLFNHFTCSWLWTIVLISRRKNHIKLIKNDDGKSKIEHWTCEKINEKIYIRFLTIGESMCIVVMVPFTFCSILNSYGFQIGYWVYYFDGSARLLNRLSAHNFHKLIHWIGNILRSMQHLAICLHNKCNNWKKRIKKAQKYVSVSSMCFRLCWWSLHSHKNYNLI